MDVSDIRIGVVVPIGHLDRFGYQRTWQDCFFNWQGWTHDLYIMPSVPLADQRDIDWESLKRYIYPSVHFARKPDGSYWFDAYRVMENVNLGIDLARKSGCDAVIVLMANNYLWDAQGLYEAAGRMIAGGNPFGYYTRYDQLADQLFGPSVRLPWLLNLSSGYQFRVSVDCLVVQEMVIWYMERGRFEPDPPCVVDVQLEMTYEDLREKMNFIRCYSDLVPKRHHRFDGGYWLPYYIHKFNRKQRGPVGTIHSFHPTFNAIAQKHQGDFVSQIVLEGLKG